MQPTQINVARFLAISFGWAWLCWLPGLLSDQTLPYDLGLVSMASGVASIETPILLLAFLSGAFGPAIAALVSRPDLLQRRAAWSCPFPWLLLAGATGLAFTALPLLFLALAGAEFSASTSFTTLVIVLLIHVFVSGMGEEPGWRGVLLPELQRRFGVSNGILWSGLIWSIWHFPLTAALIVSPMEGVAAPIIGAALMTGFVVQTVSLIALSFVYAWLLAGSGSLTVVILFHAISSTGAVFGSVIMAGGQIGFVIAAMPVLLALALGILSRRSPHLLDAKEWVVVR